MIPPKQQCTNISMGYPYSDNPHFLCPICRIPALADVEFSVDALKVAFDRGGRNTQFFGDFLVAEALRQKFQDIKFAIGQGVDHGGLNH